MPTLRELDNPASHKKLILPSTQGLPAEEQAWVVLDTGSLISADILDASASDSHIKVMALMLSRRIKEWNYTEIDGQPTPITFDSVCRLEVGDLNFLNSQIEVKSGELTTEQKKTSSPTSETSQQTATTTSTTTP